MGDSSCVVCGRREATDGHVCTLDRTRLAEQLAGLDGKVARLAVELVPGGQRGTHTDRVARSSAAATAPTRMDVLNLLGPGTDRLAALGMTGMLHPQVRRWRTIEHVTVAAGGQQRPCEIITWHQELTDAQTVHYSSSRTLQPTLRPAADLSPRRILHDDQVGLVPPAPWAHAWVQRWQHALGHHPHTPRRGRRGGQRQLLPADVRLLGYDGHSSDRPDDPRRQEWAHRFGPSERGHALTRDVDYLTTWLDEACDRNLDIADFAAQLRALTAELSRALGDKPDQYWLGRCPTKLTDRDTGTIRPCGAGIYQDPYASQVTCLRCRSVWGPAKHELIHLAVAIHREWPVDRRRRYNTTEVHCMPPVPCLACTTPVRVEWKEVTARTDRERSWQPVRAVCPQGCDTSRLI